MEQAWVTISSHLTPWGYERSDSGWNESKVPMSLSQCSPLLQSAAEGVAGAGRHLGHICLGGSTCLSCCLCSGHAAVGMLVALLRWVLRSLQLQHALPSYLWPLLCQ